MLGMKNRSLQILHLNTKEDHLLYRKYKRSINPNNPFFKIELLLAAQISLKNLKYFVYSVEDQPKILMVILIRPIIINQKTTPYYDVISPYGYSGPLFGNDVYRELIVNFWEEVDKWYKKNKIVTEFVRFNLDHNERNYSGVILPTLNNVKGEIVEEGLQWKRFKAKVRNNYRKAISQNLQFGLYFKNLGEKEVEEFYEVYIATMNRKLAAREYFYSSDYFHNFIQNNPEACAIAIVRKDNIPISAELILLSKDTIYSFLGGTKSEYFYSRPNDFLKINVLKWARSQGYKFYVLGGGRSNDDGLYKYKKSFFPKDNDVIYYTGRKIIDHKAYLHLLKLTNSLPKNNVVQITRGFFPKYREDNDITNIQDL